jgi:hypothetical protein
MTIALSATIMARVYGFGHHLSERQTWTQTVVLVLVFITMSVPLALSLSRIARETLAASQVRSFLSESFGANARVTELEVDFDRTPAAVRSVVIAPRAGAKDSRVLEAELAKRLGRVIKLQLDQVLLDPSAGVIDTQRAELRRASDIAAAEDAAAQRVAQLVALAAGVPADAVTLDREHRRASATAVPLPGAAPQTYRALEARATREANGWEVMIIPPLQALPTISFADNVDELDRDAREAVLLSAWEARRWNIPALQVPGLPEGDAPERPSLSQRRALTIAALLREQGVQALPAPAAGQRFALLPATNP